jgi:hypothetical protein
VCTVSVRLFVSKCVCVCLWVGERERESRREENEYLSVCLAKNLLPL